jgi:hypothetical protein
VQDILGSLAHARMLTPSILPRPTRPRSSGLVTIRGEIERGEFAWSRDRRCTPQH